MWVSLPAITGTDKSERGGSIDPREILHAVPGRIQLMIDGIREAAAQGDPGMANLVRLGEQEQDTASRAGLVDRIPLIDRQLDQH